MPVQPLGPTGLLAQSLTLPAGSQSMAMGGMGLRAQGMDGRKKGVRIFQIAPAVNGKTVWNLDTDGALNLGTQGIWYATPLSTFSVSAKLWGEGGTRYGGGSASAGAGGFAGGVIQLTAGVTFRLGVGQGRGPSGPYGGSGGGWSGVLVDASGVRVLIAGAGGGAGYSNASVLGGAGGWPNGGTGSTDPAGSDTGGGGATQSAAGAGGIGGGGLYSTNGSPGSGMTGGAGGYGGSGGGGGYFGGGGGAGSDFSGAGGGGGSSYFNPTFVTNQSMLSGSGTTPGNASDPARNGAGTDLNGRVILL